MVASPFSGRLTGDFLAETDLQAIPNPKALLKALFQELFMIMNPEQAWQAVLGQLQSEMPRASFDSWVRDTQFISFENNLVTVAAQPNSIGVATILLVALL